MHQLKRLNKHDTSRDFNDFAAGETKSRILVPEMPLTTLHGNRIVNLNQTIYEQ